ncbi:hypothetical protein MRB53_010336 [Persea americana]|uniref:Uncharacterized protein n=1 Tax=Persea americana TaxID=3435 RepID=A0ACC2LRJ5_PERAE|nr:hypothetical protein MRB53_010336 [Persea americana]
MEALNKVFEPRIISQRNEGRKRLKLVLKQALSGHVRELSDMEEAGVQEVTLPANALDVEQVKEDPSPSGAPAVEPNDIPSSTERVDGTASVFESMVPAFYAQRELASCSEATLAPILERIFGQSPGSESSTSTLPVSCNEVVFSSVPPSRGFFDKFRHHEGARATLKTVSLRHLDIEDSGCIRAVALRQLDFQDGGGGAAFLFIKEASGNSHQMRLDRDPLLKDLDLALGSDDPFSLIQLDTRNSISLRDGGSRPDPPLA